MSGRPPHPSDRPVKLCPAQLRAKSGFTLVELLTVMMIIGVLASLTLGIAKYIHAKEDMVKAQAEMDLISNALDRFKSNNGDYPPMDNDNGTGSPYAEQNLLMAITGHARWTQDSFGNPKWETVSMSKKMNDGSQLPTGEKYTWGVAYVDLAKLTVDVDPSTDSGIKDGAVIHDPWWQTGDTKDSAYLYRYKMRNDKSNPSTANWQTTTFLLVSRGPDGQPEEAESNFVWKNINKKATYSGLLSDSYSDPATNPFLADNLVRGSAHLPP
jgi:prepilin-type N-terminal cleavage/methylation domain-containing protein